MYTNKEFCYWLQGYFEIAKFPTLNRERLSQISQQLKQIVEPYGLYTQWLKNLIDNIIEVSTNEALVSFYTPMIRDELNHIFKHDIDNSYDSPHSLDYLYKIHQGENEQYDKF